jgi:hypothetical protein
MTTGWGLGWGCGEVKAMVAGERGQGRSLLSARW